MNRRGFLDTLLKAGVGFSILPAALTYQRRWAWKKNREVWVIDWEDIHVGGKNLSDLEMVCVADMDWHCLILPTRNFVLDAAGNAIEV